MRISLKACIQPPVSSLEADAAVAELVKLLELRQFDLELKRDATVTAGQRHQQASIEAIAAGGLDLASDEVDRALPMYGQHVIRKASQIHGLLSLLLS